MSLPWKSIPITLSQFQIEAILRTFDHSVFLDSGKQTKGRYDILSAAPVNSLARNHTSLRQDIPPEFETLPFVCGEIGFLSYEEGKSLALNRPSQSDIDFPASFSAYYTWSYIFDYIKEEGHLIFSPLCSAELRQRIIDVIEESTNKVSKSIETSHTALIWKRSNSQEEYEKQYKKVKQYILAGDCYQINLTQRFETTFIENIVNLYFRLRARTNTHYACYFSLANKYSILSFSPEQFISINNRRIETKPIKGTIANHDRTSEETLISSEKNRAENLMIVDLLRNDLSKVSKPHSVNAPKLFELESYKNVHHLVSTIVGTLEEDVSEKDAFLSCFPGGSITGAPKRRAMEIIEELEPHSRSAYCGSVYYLNDNGAFDSNILIRTIVQSDDTLYCWGGGGIVSDSDMKEEYEESITKVRNLFDKLLDC